MQIILAREYLKDVTLNREQLKYLVIEALRGGCQVNSLQFFLHLGKNFLYGTFDVRNRYSEVTSIYCLSRKVIDSAVLWIKSAPDCFIYLLIADKNILPNFCYINIKLLIIYWSFKPSKWMGLA